MHACPRPNLCHQRNSVQPVLDEPRLGAVLYVRCCVEQLARAMCLDRNVKIANRQQDGVHVNITSKDESVTLVRTDDILDHTDAQVHLTTLW